MYEEIEQLVINIKMIAAVEWDRILIKRVDVISVQGCNQQSNCILLLQC